MWIDLDAIQLWQSNPNEGEVGLICALIERFGFRNPIGLNKDNVTYNGNHRVIALRQLRKQGWQPYGSCIRTVGERWEVQCVDNTDLNEQDSVAWGLGDNRSSRLGRDDAETLLLHLEPLPEIERAILGYDDSDIQALQATVYGGNGKSKSDDTVLKCPHCNKVFE